MISLPKPDYIEEKDLQRSIEIYRDLLKSFKIIWKAQKVIFIDLRRSRSMLILSLVYLRLRRSN